MPEPRSGPDRRRHGRPVHDDLVTDRMDHELLDLGEGRQLERLGSVVLDRPCPAAAWHTARDPAAWAAADARFDRQGDGVGATERKLQLLNKYRSFIYEARLAEILASLAK